MKTPVIFSDLLPDRLQFPEESVLLYDSVLAKKPHFRKWASHFRYKIALKAGEDLKTLRSLTTVLGRLSSMEVSKSTKLTFVAVGGGSVGDFSGFLAGIYMRGRGLVLIPSTWLSAVDSAHGGKNGLNHQKSKNQIGLIYPPSRIFICGEILKSQPQTRLRESLGEVVKTAVIGDKKLFSLLEKKSFTEKDLIKHLPRIIALKYAVVRRDPFEKKGTRRLLNLGHTMGHVFESCFGWPHGVAVLLGLQFSARWSYHRGLLVQKEKIRIDNFIESLDLDISLNQALKNLPAKKWVRHLAQDKKLIAKNSMDFIFIRAIGRCIRNPVKIEDIVNEVSRQRRGADV